MEQAHSYVKDLTGTNMLHFEVTLRVAVNGSNAVVKTVVVAGSAYQAQQLAIAQYGNGCIAFCARRIN